MNQELKLGLLELNDIYYALSTVSRDKDTHRSKEMAELADQVLDHIDTKCKELDELVADVRAYHKGKGNE